MTEHNHSLWEKTKEVSSDAWEATKDGASKAWEKTKEWSGDAWEATKKGAAKTEDFIVGEPDDTLDNNHDIHKIAIKDEKCNHHDHNFQ